MKTLVFGLFAIGILITSNSYGFGRKKMQLSELKGVTETQVAKQTGKAMIMVRGKAAELIFRMMKREREERTDSEALKWIGSKSGSEMIVKGRQITCSMISWGKKKHEDYACSFEMDRTGTLSATKTAFSPTTFNLAKTSTGSKAFKEKGRSLASVTPTTTYSKGLAYLVYDKPGNQKRAENAMIVFRGESAKDILELLGNGPEFNSARWGQAKGNKGDDIACVGATGNEPERCAMVVSFKDGSITRTGNPLFR